MLLATGFFASTLANLGCATMTRASVGSPVSTAWLVEHDNDHAAVRFKAPWNSYLRGQLTRAPQTLPSAPVSSTQIRLAGRADERAIPLAWVRDVKVVRRARGAGEGALMGGAAGVACGVVFAVLATDYGRTIGCSEGRSCHDRNLPRAVGGGLVYGVILSGPIGAALGALVGGVIGHRDLLTFD